MYILEYEGEFVESFENYAAAVRYVAKHWAIHINDLMSEGIDTSNYKLDEEFHDYKLLKVENQSLFFQDVTKRLIRGFPTDE